MRSPFKQARSSAESLQRRIPNECRWDVKDGQNDGVENKYFVKDSAKGIVCPNLKLTAMQGLFHVQVVAFV